MIVEGDAVQCRGGEYLVFGELIGLEMVLEFPAERDANVSSGGPQEALLDAGPQAVKREASEAPVVGEVREVPSVAVIIDMRATE